VNTNGFKKERMEFKSLLYETMRTAGDVTEGGEPVNLQVGHGVRAAGSVKTFSQGNFEQTEAPLDFAIAGNGFFAIQTQSGETQYTKDGSLKMAVSDGELMLTDVSGNPVLNTDGEAITFDGTISLDNLSVDEDGNFTYVSDGVSTDLGIQMQVAQFSNITGLQAMGNGLFAATVASGEAMIESENEDLTSSSIIQGTIESSNVQAVEEMVKMIIAQRAYELSSKAIQTSDDMLSTANSLKR
jgi:flagellar basal-body rod protein FlgG